MSKTYKLKLPPKIQNWFIASDFHLDHLHKPSLNILIKQAELLPKWHRNLIINGDVNDFAFLMPKSDLFKKWIKRTDGIPEFFIPNYDAEVALCNDFLDRLQKTFRNIIFIYGNHDERALYFREQYCHEAYKHNFILEDSLHLKKRKIPFIRYNDWLDFGELSVTHGQNHGAQCLKKHYELAGARSVIFGHIHKTRSESFIVRGKTRRAWSLPAMSELNPHWIKNFENDWSNGYGQILMKPNGHFNFQINDIWDGELVLSDGTLLKG